MLCVCKNIQYHLEIILYHNHSFQHISTSKDNGHYSEENMKWGTFSNDLHFILYSSLGNVHTNKYIHKFFSVGNLQRKKKQQSEHKTDFSPLNK